MGKVNSFLNMNYVLFSNTHHCFPWYGCDNDLGHRQGVRGTHARPASQELTVVTTKAKPLVYYRQSLLSVYFEKDSTDALTSHGQLTQTIRRVRMLPDRDMTRRVGVATYPQNPHSYRRKRCDSDSDKIWAKRPGVPVLTKSGPKPVGTNKDPLPNNMALHFLVPRWGILFSYFGIIAKLWKSTLTPMNPFMQRTGLGHGKKNMMKTKSSILCYWQPKSSGNVAQA